MLPWIEDVISEASDKDCTAPALLVAPLALEALRCHTQET